MSYCFTPPPIPQLPVARRDEFFPIHRIYCVARNYADHAKEMGFDQPEPPFFFHKPADAVVASGATIAYPSATQNLHHEIELVVALGEGGRHIAPQDALDKVFGYAVGLDLTRRDLQQAARQVGKPWDTSKGFDDSAPCSAIHPVADVGHRQEGRIWLAVNDEVRQNGDLNEMIWSVADIIAELSNFYTLQAGDLIFTGTPAGVGAIGRGDEVYGGIEGIDEVRLWIAP